MRFATVLPLIALVALVAACSHAARPAVAARPVAARPVVAAATAPQILAAIENRVADLKTRGADCQAEADVLDRALVNGMITLRPFMWREGANLASARGESSGQLTIARDIDSLNVGVRGLDDVLYSAEHEAVHIASRIPSGTRIGEALIDEHVRACRGQSLR
jgi:hypothetical protein